MEKNYEKDNFTISPKKWFEGYWGSFPEEQDLAGLFKKEPGAAELFRKIFSEPYLVHSQTNEMNKHKGK